LKGFGMEDYTPGDALQGAKKMVGKAMSADDYALSLMIALHIGARWGHCYENAYPAFFAFPELFEPGGFLVEGWVVFEDDKRVVLFEHGWCMCGEHIIDPTIVLNVAPDQPLYFFPGVFRGRAELEALENELFPHVRFDSYGDDGMGHPGYRAAYDAAQQQARALVTKEKPFVEVQAAVIAPQDEETERESSGLGVIFVLENGKEPYGQKRG
jgi:hypothetical protein